MAIIKKYKSIIQSIENPLPDVFVVTIKSLEKPFKYLPGQFLHLALDSYDPSSAWPESRCFSIQSNGNEEIIKLTFSVKGKFTKRMSEELKNGKEVWLKLPYGELFTKEHDKNNCVFIAGGTGITPFFSLFTSDQFTDYINPILYFGLKNKSYNIYNDELEKSLSKNNNFIIKLLHQDKDGIIDIQKILNDYNIDKTFFISGPPVMIKNFKNYLLGNGVSSDRIKTDDWE